MALVKEGDLDAASPSAWPLPLPFQCCREAVRRYGCLEEGGSDAKEPERVPGMKVAIGTSGELSLGERGEELRRKRAGRGGGSRVQAGRLRRRRRAGR